MELSEKNTSSFLTKTSAALANIFIMVLALCKTDHGIFRTWRQTLVVTSCLWMTLSWLTSCSATEKFTTWCTLCWECRLTCLVRGHSLRLSDVTPWRCVVRTMYSIFFIRWDCRQMVWRYSNRFTDVCYGSSVWASQTKAEVSLKHWF